MINNRHMSAWTEFDVKNVKVCIVERGLVSTSRISSAESEELCVGQGLGTVVFQSDRTENRIGLKSSFMIRIGSHTHTIRFQSNRRAARSNQIPLCGGSWPLAVLWDFSLICSCTWNSETCSQGCMEIDPVALPNKSISQWLRLTLENRKLMWVWPRGGPEGMGFRFS